MANEPLTPDESALIRLYNNVLWDAWVQERRYESNYHIFQRWDDYQRLLWIYYVERQAANGLPMAVDLVRRATVRRLKG